MIRLLTDSFWRHMNDSRLDTDEKMYSEILADLERAGMRPPESLHIVGRPFLGKHEVVYLNEWQPEDREYNHEKK